MPSLGLPAYYNFFPRGDDESQSNDGTINRTKFFSDYFLSFLILLFKVLLIILVVFICTRGILIYWAGHNLKSYVNHHAWIISDFACNIIPQSALTYMFIHTLHSQPKYRWIIALNVIITGAGLATVIIHLGFPWHVPEKQIKMANAMWEPCDCVFAPYMKLYESLQYVYYLPISLFVSLLLIFIESFIVQRIKIILNKQTHSNAQSMNIKLLNKTTITTTTHTGAPTVTAGGLINQQSQQQLLSVQNNGGTSGISGISVTGTPNSMIVNIDEENPMLIRMPQQIIEHNYARRKSNKIQKLNNKTSGQNGNGNGNDGDNNNNTLNDSIYNSLPITFVATRPPSLSVTAANARAVLNGGGNGSGIIASGGKEEDSVGMIVNYDIDDVEMNFDNDNDNGISNGIGNGNVNGNVNEQNSKGNYSIVLKNERDNDYNDEYDEDELIEPIHWTSYVKIWILLIFFICLLLYVQYSTKNLSPNYSNTSEKYEHVIRFWLAFSVIIKIILKKLGHTFDLLRVRMKQYRLQQSILKHKRQYSQTR